MRRGRTMAAAAAALVAALATAGGSLAATLAAPYSWRSVPFGGGGFVDGFLYHPKQPDLLYARTDMGGAYRFDFARKRWIPLLDWLDHADSDLVGVLSLAIDPNDPNRLYLACGEYLGPQARTGAVLRSDDQGRTWKRFELGVRLGSNSDGRGSGERLQVDPNAGDILFLGTSRDGLWKSTDQGASFKKIPGSPAASISLVLFDPASGAKGSASRTLYVGSDDKPGGLWVSHDGGSSFALVPGVPRQTPQHAVFDRAGDLYVTFAESDGRGPVNPSFAKDGGVWKMDRSGRWSDVTPVRPGSEPFGYSGVDVDPAHPGVVAVSTLDRFKTGDDIFLSKDAGAHWAPLGPHASHDASPWPWLVNYTQGRDRMGHWISDVKINPFNPDELIYGTGYGLWMSRDLTAAERTSRVPAHVDFDFADEGFEETVAIRLAAPASGAKVLAALGDVGGAGWDDLTRTPAELLFPPENETNNWIDVAALKPAFLVRTAERSPSHGFYSTDGGGRWVPFPATPVHGVGRGHRPGAIAVSAGASAIVWAPERQGGFYSLDRGRTWTPSAGWPQQSAQGRVPALVPVADRAQDKVFYLYDPAAGQVLQSVDGGAAFKPMLEGLPHVEGWRGADLETAPGRAGDLWLAGPFGLEHSPGRGLPMAAVAGVEQAWLVSFGKAAPGRDYPAVFLYGTVKGQDGLFRSDDEGTSWTRIDDDAHRYGRLDSLAGDLNQYGVVYIGPEGRGVLVGEPQR